MHSSASTERQSSGECSGIPKLKTGSDSSDGSRKSNLKQPGKTPIRSTTIMSQQTPTGMTPRAGHFNSNLPTGPRDRSPSAERCSTLGSQKMSKKDTRNLTNKSTQKALLNRIDNYFLETYPSSSVLNLDITTKPQLTQANYIDELPKYSKKLHYPSNMSKSWLKTANTPHLYPDVVGSPCGPYEIEGDEPVDYSQQYLEKNQSKIEKIIEVQLQNDDKYFPKDNQNIFGDYTETDLDQPTDYSLRYAEDDTDDDEKQSRHYFTPTEQEDTVKTYCTEGTPYETPFNFSNATSMSDLHLDSESLDNKNDAEVIELPEDLIHKKDKPVNKEDTEETVGTSNEQSPQKQNDKEEKVVTFGTEDHYAEETPLMFSRSSSFSSLSELEQISINEDRSSIISDFSRQTSGVVSPSELPDSPCQTVPPSPRYKNSIDYSFRNNARSPDGVHVYCTEDTPANISPAGSQLNLSALSMPSIIEDFEKPNDESETRNNLSDSSDSSILFDDDDDDDDDKILDECIQLGMPKRSSPFRTLSLVVNISFDDSPNQSDDDDDDDDDAILAKCIESGMPKTTILSTNPSPLTSRSIDTTKNNLKSEQTKSLGSEDSLSLSNDEEDLILEQCIRSGMSKMNVKNMVKNSKYTTFISSYSWMDIMAC